MKISLLLTLVTTLNVSAVLYSQDTKLNLSIKNQALIDVIRQIEHQSNYRFFFSDNYQDLNDMVSITANDNSINEVLTNLLKDKAITYRLLDNNIVVITPLETSLQQKITGTILDATTKEPLIGVNISIEGTTQGTSSDVNGNYTIEVPDQNSVLVFTYVGYVTERIKAAGQTTINVSLSQDVKAIQEVVVTALGIKRDKKALTYSSQQLSKDEISKGHDLNFVESLSGRAAGIDLRQSNAGAGGSTKILLRGTKSFYGSSQPLFVIDGVPLANYQTSDASGMWGGHDSGDGLSNLNPDDIESINILKGANAASLYGSQGSNGVVIITTKKGVKGKAKVEISSSTAFQTASILPKLQTSYGQTAIGALDSWGTKGSYSNPVDGFFRTGLDLLNTISISGGNENTSAYLSYANSHSQGIMPTNLFNKNNLTFSQKSIFFKNFEVSSNVMLTDQSIHNKVTNGYYWNPLTGLYLFPRGLDFNSYKNKYQVFDPNRNLMTQNWWIYNVDTQQNPYWILNNDQNNEATKRIVASLNLTYKISNALSIQARGNYDYTNQIFEMDAKAGTSSPLIGGGTNSNGRWNYTNLTSTQQYADLILNYDKDFGETFDVHGVFGTSYQKRIIGDGTIIDTKQNGLIVPNEFYLNNVNTASFNGVMQSTLASRDIKESVFGNLSVGYKKMLYLDMSGRNEWSSSLAVPGSNNVSYFYPSVGLSAILNEMMTLPQAINFAKLRTSFAYVGKEIPSFMTIPENTVDAANGIKLNTQIPYRTLKPEMQKSLELGAEMRFLDSRVGFEATYYNINNTNEFLQLAAPAGSGYSTYFVNAGQIKNTGAEVTLTFVPVKSNNITWESGINYALNRNKIVKLDPTLKGQYSNGQGGEGYDMTIAEGGSIGDIYVAAYQRDSISGKVILDNDNLPVMAKDQKLIGSANPKFALGWNNTIKYKNLSLSFLIDGKFGGKFVDMTEAWYDGFGLSQRSADARDAGGVNVTGVKADRTPVSATVDAKSYYTRIGGRNSFVEPYVYDATNIRLRQVVLTYNLNLKPYHILFDNATISLVGRNLFFFYRQAPFDPDNTISTGINSQSVENFSLPPTRSIGFNVKLNF